MTQEYNALETQKSCLKVVRVTCYLWIIFWDQTFGCHSQKVRISLSVCAIGL